MADILILGMEMPKTCDDCFLPLRYCPYAMKENGECPLLPLPERHGRLIDADAIEYTYTTARGNDDGHNWRIFAVGEDEIDEMPTIVPAEGGTE